MHPSRVELAVTIAPSHDSAHDWPHQGTDDERDPALAALEEAWRNGQLAAAEA